MLPQETLSLRFNQLISRSGWSVAVEVAFPRQAGRIARDGGSIVARSPLERLSRPQPEQAFRIAGCFAGEMAVAGSGPARQYGTRLAMGPSISGARLEMMRFDQPGGEFGARCLRSGGRITNRCSGRRHGPISCSR